jgi:hypothetical protein
MRTPSDGPTRKQRIRAVGQIVLGLAQVMAATVALYLVVATGISEWSVGAVVVAGLLVAASKLLFGGRKEKQR